MREKLKTFGKLKLLATPGAKPAAVTGIVAGPLIWLAALQVKYSLVPFACWLGWRMALHAVTVVALVLVFAAGILCWRTWRVAGSEWPGETDSLDDRNRFLALLGLGMSGFAFLAIVGQEIGNFVLDPCQ